jgi:phosphomevalonate kinase
MIRRCEAHAPGKLVLVGEYAVLDGAPALSAAVDCRARATVCVADEFELRIVNDDACFQFTLDAAGEPVWRENPGARGAVLSAALATLQARGVWPTDASGFRIELCTREFYGAGADGSVQKIGIGSSAAIAVALLAALQTFLGERPSLDACMDAHRRLQHGAGSGVDVATSWYGGVIVMRPNGGDLPEVQQSGWPPGLCMQPVWTGNTASTPAMLAHFAAFKVESPTVWLDLLQRLRQVSEAAVAGWTAQDTAAVINALAHYGELLAELDKAAGIGIWSACHRQLAELAEACEVAYKPSGAGGGDFGLVISPDADKLAAFRLRAEEAGFSQALAPDWHGAGVVVSTD